MDETTSPSIVDGIKSPTNAWAWERFLAKYEPFIEGWLIKAGLSADAARDVRQNVMATVVQEIGNFEHNGRLGAFRTWLKQITRNRLKDFIRRETRQPRTLGPDSRDVIRAVEDPYDDLWRRLDEEHERHVINLALAQVARKFTEPSIQSFRRVVLDGVPAPQAATELAMTPNAVRIAVSRVLKRLREFDLDSLE